MQGCQDMVLQRWSYDVDLLGSRDVIGHVTVGLACSYMRSFETISLSRIVAEILCEKHLAKHMVTENVLIPIFVF